MKKLFSLLLVCLITTSIAAQMKVHSNGKVSVGGNSTANGNLTITGNAATKGLAFYNGNSNPLRIYMKGTDAFISRIDSVYSNIRINQSGQITISSTPNFYGYGNQLSVFGNSVSAISSTFYHPSNNGGDGLKSVVEHPLNITYAGYYKGSSSSWQKNFYVQGTGNVYCAGTITTSDRSIKEDIQKIKNPIDLILQLEGVSYINKNRQEMKDSYYRGLTQEDEMLIKQDSLYDKQYADMLISEMDKRDMGLIAQDVEKVLPDIVYSVDKEKKGIAYTQLIALLIEGIKAQQVEIESLKLDLESLRSESALFRAHNKELQVTENENDSSIEDLPESPTMFQNVPNPFDHSTLIPYYLPKSVKSASICVYNLQGTQLKRYELTDRGEASITILSSDFNAGIYFYALIADGIEVDIKRMMISE